MSNQNTDDDGNQEMINVLTQDHRKVIDLFKQFQEIRKGKDKNSKQFLVEVVCTELVIHAQVEDEILYPALQAAFKEHDFLDQALVEHEIAHQLINELEMMEPDDELYDARFTVLCEYVQHHIMEEESRIFPKLKSSPLPEDTVVALIKRRKELRNEFGMPDEYEIPTVQPVPPSQDMAFSMN